MNNSNIVAYDEAKYMQLSISFNYENPDNAFYNLEKYVKSLYTWLWAFYWSLLSTPFPGESQDSKWSVGCKKIIWKLKEQIKPHQCKCHLHYLQINNEGPLCRRLMTFIKQKIINYILKDINSITVYFKCSNYLAHKCVSCLI